MQRRLLYTANKTSLLYHFRPKLPLPPDQYERPTPVLLVCGEGLSRNIWMPYSQRLTERGFCGSILELDPAATTIKQLTLQMNAAIKESGYWPPVMITHSLSSFVAQKYLESFSVAGLVMINPYPPAPTSAFKAMLRDTQSLAPQDKVRELYRIPSSAPLEQLTAASFPSAVLEDVCEKSMAVRLEPKAVPLLLAVSAEDKYLDQAALQSLVECHGIEQAHVKRLSSTSRVPMITDLDELDDVLIAWIEDNID